jgi:hypothetical protein
MGTFHSRIRIAIAVFGLAAAGAVVLYARAAAKALPIGSAEPLEDASDGLAIAAALYVANWILAWVYRTSWPVTLARCLVFAVVAYVGLSGLVDLFGEHRAIAWQIAGVDPVVDPLAVEGLRAQGLCSLAVIGLSAIAISLGFEPRTP